MATVIESLITEFGFEIDEEKLEAFEKALGNAVKGLTAVVAAAVGAGAGVFEFTRRIAEANDEIAKQARLIGIDVEAFQEWGYIAQLNGGSFDGMSSSLENLNRVSSEAARGTGAGIEAFGLLGLSVTDINGRLKNTDSLMLEVADALAQLDTQAERIEIGQKLGIDPKAILTLMQGSAAIRAQRQEARELGLVIDEDATEAAEKFVDSMLRVNSIVKGVSSAIGTRLMKQLNPMVDTFVEWFKANRRLISQKLSAFLEIVLKFVRFIFSFLARVVGVTNSVVEAFGGWERAIKLAAAAFLLLNAQALLVPALILAAGAAIFLLIEDIVKFAEGGDSALGNLAKRFPWIKESLDVIIDILKLVKDGWDQIFENGPEIIDFTIEKIKELGKTITDFFENPIDNAIAAITEKFPKFSNFLEGIGNFVGGTSALPVSNNTASSYVTTNEGNNVTVNVNGGNQSEVRRTIKEALGEDYRAAANNLKTPVDF